jgi:hypothetical protein
MKWGFGIIIGFMLVGCAAQRQPSNNRYEAIPTSAYLPATSTPLVFDPPVTLGQAPLELSRDGRAVDAFVGYESVTATYFYLRTDDRQMDNSNLHNNDRYERRAVSEKVGVTYR